MKPVKISSGGFTRFRACNIHNQYQLLKYNQTFVIFLYLADVMASKYYILVLVSILLLSPGCINDNESEDEDTITTIDPNSQTMNNYVGFLDNSSIYGLEINPIEDFSRIYVAMNEENCTSAEFDEWIGVWNDPWCTTNFGENIDSVTHQNGELCFEHDNEQGCWNMTVSNRVMWLQGDLFGGQEDICAVYIQSEQFTPTGSYNLSINTNEGDNGHIPVDWDDLWADPDYTTWENERMSAYNAESANQPSWCVEPIFDWLHWASSPDE